MDWADVLDLLRILDYDEKHEGALAALAHVSGSYPLDPHEIRDWINTLI